VKEATRVYEKLHGTDAECAWCVPKLRQRTFCKGNKCKKRKREDSVGLFRTTS
jgi:hypothetical protein